MTETEFLLCKKLKLLQLKGMVIHAEFIPDKVGQYLYLLRLGMAMVMLDIVSYKREK